MHVKTFGRPLYTIKGRDYEFSRVFKVTLLKDRVLTGY